MEDIILDYGAISIDNCILKNHGYKFEEGILKELSQFAGSPVSVIQTDIVHNEAKKHIAAEVAEANKKIEQALRAASIHLKVAEDDIAKVREILKPDRDPAEVAEEILTKFCYDTGASVLSTKKSINVDQLLDMYFDTKAPFESKKDKKNEFPDAMALLSIEEYANKSNKKIIAVSNDRGWMAFAESSKNIKVVNSLAKALELFQPHTQVKSIISGMRRANLLSTENHILYTINQEIISSTANADITAEATSSYNLHVDNDFTWVEYDSHNFIKDQSGMAIIKIIGIEGATITLQISAEVNCSIFADFTFSGWDVFDNEYVAINTKSYGYDETYTTDIIIKLTGDFTKGIDNVMVDSVNVLSPINHADFGDLAADWAEHEE